MRVRFLLIMMILSLYGCKQAQPAAPVMAPPEVTVASPTRTDVIDYAYYNGHTEARKTVEIRARAEGYLRELNFKPGQYVDKGALLFRIDPKPYEARVREAEAELTSRKTTLELLEVTLRRNEEAYKEKAVSEIVVLESRARRDQAVAAIEAATAMLETARIDLGYTEVRAPLAGRMGRNLVDEGNLIRGGDQTVLATLVADDPIYVYFHMSDRDLLNYREVLSTKDLGTIPVEMGLGEESEYTYQGKLDFLDTNVNSSTGTLEARAVFPNKSHNLSPGLFAHVRLPLGHLPDALLVPETALGIDQGGRFLLVVDAQNVVQYMHVEIGPLINGQRVIVSGLDANTSVIVNGLQRARPGAPVTPKSQAAVADAPGTM